MTKHSSFFILGIDSYLCFPEMFPCRRRFRNLVPSVGPKRGSVLTPYGLQLWVPHLYFFPQNTPLDPCSAARFLPENLPASVPQLTQILTGRGQCEGIGGPKTGAKMSCNPAQPHTAAWTLAVPQGLATGPLWSGVHMSKNLRAQEAQGCSEGQAFHRDHTGDRREKLLVGRVS